MEEKLAIKNSSDEEVTPEVSVNIGTQQELNPDSNSHEYEQEENPEQVNDPIQQEEEDDEIEFEEPKGDNPFSFSMPPPPPKPATQPSKQPMPELEDDGFKAPMPLGNPNPSSSNLISWGSKKPTLSTPQQTRQPLHQKDSFVKLSLSTAINFEELEKDPR